MNQKDDPARLDAQAYPLRFQHRVLFADMDSFRHVNNGAIGRFFEEGRADLNMKVFGPDCLTDPPGGLQMLFARITVDYLLPARYPGTIEVATGISRIGGSSCVQAQGAFQDGACFALSETVLVKAINGKPTALSDQEREILQSLMIHS